MDGCIRPERYRGVSDAGHTIFGQLYTDNTGWSLISDMGDRRHVVQDSVGRCTWVQDTEGRVIYEGDVLMVDNSESELVGVHFGKFNVSALDHYEPVDLVVGWCIVPIKTQKPDSWPMPLTRDRVADMHLCVLTDTSSLSSEDKSYACIKPQKYCGTTYKGAKVYGQLIVKGDSWYIVDGAGLPTPVQPQSVGRHTWVDDYGGVSIYDIDTMLAADDVIGKCTVRYSKFDLYDLEGDSVVGKVLGWHIDFLKGVGPWNGVYPLNAIWVRNLKLRVCQ